MLPKPSGDFAQYREQILHAIMVAASTAGLLAYLPAVYVAREYGQPSVVIVDTLAYLTVVALAIARHRVPYLVRAWALPVVTFALGIFLTTRYGPRLGGWTWLVASPVLAAVLLGLRAASWSLAAVFGALLAIAFAQVAGVLDWTTPGLQPTTAWIVSSTSSLFLTAILALSVGYMLQSLRAETEFRRAVEEERASLALAVQQSPDFVVITDFGGTVVYVNAAFTRVTGWEAEEVVGYPLDLDGIFNRGGELPPGIIAALRNASAWHGNLVGACRSGTRFDAEGTLTPLRDTEGRVAYQVLTLRDTTREFALGRQLHQAQKLEAIGTLAGGIAHDFNNLLLPILANSEQLLDRLPPDDPARDPLADVVLSARRARELVHRILTFSRRREPHRIPIRVDEVAHEVVRLLRPSLPAGIEVRVVVPEGEFAVSADAGELHQVFMNLATNAWQAMSDRGTGLLTLELDLVSAEHDPELAARGVVGDWVRLEVRDTGVGMSPAVLERAFDPFFTTKSVGEGTGLGLATVHGVILSLGGHLAATSTVGQGTTVAVYLRPTKLIEVDPGSALPSRPSTGLMVLLVDDEPAVLRATERLIQRLGHSVVARSAPDAALALLRERPGQFDLLFTDLTMPGMNGIELARRARALHPDIRVILASGYLDTATRAEVSEAGVRHVVAKPFDIGELDTVLSQVGSATA